MIVGVRKMKRTKKRRKRFEKERDEDRYYRTDQEFWNV
jgi:hypothetical protein